MFAFNSLLGCHLRHLIDWHNLLLIFVKNLIYISRGGVLPLVLVRVCSGHMGGFWIENSLNVGGFLEIFFIKLRWKAISDDLFGIFY